MSNQVAPAEAVPFVQAQPDAAVLVFRLALPLVSVMALSVCIFDVLDPLGQALYRGGLGWVAVRIALFVAHWAAWDLVISRARPGLSAALFALYLLLSNVFSLFGSGALALLMYGVAAHGNVHGIVPWPVDVVHAIVVVLVGTLAGGLALRDRTPHLRWLAIACLVSVGLRMVAFAPVPLPDAVWVVLGPPLLVVRALVPLLALYAAIAQGAWGVQARLAEVVLTYVALAGAVVFGLGLVAVVVGLQQSDASVIELQRAAIIVFVALWTPLLRRAIRFAMVP